LKTAAAAAAAAPGKTTASAPAQQRPVTMTQRPAAAAAPAIKTIDKVLIYTTLAATLAGVGFSFYVMWFVLKPAIENFQP
jgi:hypothetical protein